MDAEPQPMKGQKPKRRAGLWIIGGLVAVTAGAYVLLASRFDPGYGAGEYEAAKREYLAAGLPWTAKDLAPNPPIRPEEDATTLILDLIKSFDEPTFQKVTRGLRPADAGAAEAIAPFAKIFDRAAGLDQKSSLSFPRDYDLAQELTYPEYAPLRAIAKGLAFRAEIGAISGDRAGAVADLRAAYAVARLTAKDPSFIGALVAIALDGIANSAARRIADRRPEWGPDLAKLVGSQPPLDPTPAIRGEAYMLLSTLRNLSRYGGFFSFKNSLNKAWTEEEALVSEGPITRDGDPAGRIARAQVRPFMRFFAEAVRLLKSRGPRSAVGEALDRRADSLTDPTVASNALASILMPVLPPGFKAIDRRAAELALTRLYIRLAERRANLPADGWIPPGADPWGNAFVYRRTPDGFRLYSKGPNGKDDGGVTLREWARTAPAPRENPADDVAVIYPSREDGSPK